MCVCLKHRTVLSYISFFFQYVPQFPKTMLIAIMTLIWISRQKHLFLFHLENMNTRKGNFSLHHQIYRLIWTQTLPFLLLLEINFPSFSPTPALHWYNGSLLFIQGLCSHDYTSSSIIRFPSALGPSHEQRTPVMGWIVSLKRRYVEVLTLRMWPCLEIRSSQIGVVKTRWQGGPQRECYETMKRLELCSCRARNAKDFWKTTRN